MCKHAFNGVKAMKMERMADKVILLLLADHLGEAGSFPSHETLQFEAACNAKTVTHALRRLKEDGHIEDTGERRGQSGRVVVWRLPAWEIGPKTDATALAIGPKTDTTAWAIGPKTDVNRSVLGGQSVRKRTAEPSSEPSQERTNTHHARESGASGSGISLVKEGRVPLPGDWQPDGVTLALAQELVGDRAGVELAAFEDYYAARPTLLDANWQARAQTWLRRDTKPRASQGQAGVSRGRAGRVAPGFKKTTAPTLGEVQTWLDSLDQDEDLAAICTAELYLEAIELLAPERQRGDVATLLEPIAHMARLGYEPGSMVRDAQAWLPQSRNGPPQSLKMFVGLWERTSLRMGLIVGHERVVGAEYDFYPRRPGR